MLAQINQYLPRMLKSLNQIQYDVQNQISKESLTKFFIHAESISIDYGIMEKAKNMVAFEFDVGWSDVGTWTGLKNLQKEYNLDLPNEVKKFMPP